MVFSYLYTENCHFGCSSMCMYLTLQGKIVFFFSFIICCVFGRSTYSISIREMFDWMIWPERFKWIVLLEWWILCKSYRYNEFKVRDVVGILNLDIAYTNTSMICDAHYQFINCVEHFVQVVHISISIQTDISI